MYDYFDAPPEGATGSGFGSFERPVTVNYKSGKTPKEYVQLAADNLEKHIADGVVGFYTYNGKDNPKTPYKKFSFILLAAYAGVAGKDGSVNYWSNRSADTRVEPLSVFASNSYEMRGDKKKWKPILSGLYNRDFTKHDLPSGAKYTTFLVAYCLETESVVEIQCTNAVTTGLENALKEAGQKNTFLLSLTQNDHIWGFTLTGYAQIAKDGQPYAGFGEMFWQPTFRVGLLNGQKAPDLFAKVVSLQRQERERHESYKQASSQPEQTPAPEQPAQPAQTNVRPSADANTVSVPATMATPVGRKEPEPEIDEPEDLPF